MKDLKNLAIVLGIIFMTVWIFFTLMSWLFVAAMGQESSLLSVLKGQAHVISLLRI